MTLEDIMALHDDPAAMREAIIAYGEEWRAVGSAEVTAERDALRADVPKWWNCDTHGGQQHAWGCPECVRELRTQNAALRDHLKKANAQTEEFERKWYLVGDERDALRAFAQNVIATSNPDDWTWDVLAKHKMVRFDRDTNVYIETPLLTGEQQT